jgi:hypothetical protein
VIFHSKSDESASKASALVDRSPHHPKNLAAARLVNPDGDVIWTSTQESKGAKYKGASADVADKIIKQLLHDLEKLEKK